MDRIKKKYQADFKVKFKVLDSVTAEYRASVLDKKYQAVPGDECIVHNENL